MSKILCASARPSLGGMLAILACCAVVYGLPAVASSRVACQGQCANSTTYLTAEMVDGIIARAFHESRALGATNVTIAVVDRVGNVLGVFESKGALEQAKSPDLKGVGGLVTINSGRFSLGKPGYISLPSALFVFGHYPPPETGIGGSLPQLRNGQQAGLENIQVPSSIAAISKAITGAYLSSENNAFSTLTAAQIIQEHFNPGINYQAGGPLFGVQFSQLPCGDFVTQGGDVGVGPRRSPLGFSGQRGGLPLYLRGTPVGGIGVIATSQYSIELNVTNPGYSIDEQIAIAGSYGFQAPVNRQANAIHVGGVTLRYTGNTKQTLVSNPGTAPNLSEVIAAGQGSFLPVPGYFESSTARNGTAFGQPESGIAPATAPFQGLNAYMLTNSLGENKYPPINGDPNLGQNLNTSDVTLLLRNVVTIANDARAQIRNPASSRARLSAAVVDLNGNILGLLRSQDAPVFSTDVAIQKARSGAFFSQSNAASLLRGTNFSSYVKRAQLLIPHATRGAFLADGSAVPPRALGNIARPLLPDGINNTPTGPFSLPYLPVSTFIQGANEWSPFNIGLELDLVYSDLLYAITNPFTSPPGGNPIQNCTASSPTLGKALANGPQFFPGGVPLYKKGVLVGAIGTSGDGIDQDDMGSFLSTYLTGASGHSDVRNASVGIRSNLINFNDGYETVSLRFIQCPYAPFVNSDTQKACSGK